jgi:hypothetical protein
VTASPKLPITGGDQPGREIPVAVTGTIRNRMASAWTVASASHSAIAVISQL